LSQILSIDDFSERGLVERLMAASGMGSGFPRLLWEGLRRMCCREAVEGYLFHREVSRTVLPALRVGTVICFPNFQVLTLGRSMVSSHVATTGPVRVAFEAGNVLLHPMVTRTERGFVIRAGEGVLGPFTPLRVTHLTIEAGSVPVIGVRGMVEGTRIIGGPGVTRRRVLECVCEDAEAHYCRGLEKGSTPDAMSAFGRAAAMGHVQAMARLGFSGYQRGTGLWVWNGSARQESVAIRLP
jgi:hypothetical protein